MIGNLEPEEHVMSDSSAWEDGGIMDQVNDLIETLGWSDGDEIDVEIGGMAISGIDVGEEYNKKWQSPLGTRKYNKDAFIIIKNQSRRDFSKSQPNPDLKQQHQYGNQTPETRGTTEEDS